MLPLFGCSVRVGSPNALLFTTGAQLLEGEEVSVFAVCDGREAQPLAPARDFKRVGDGDVGPNTGGWFASSRVCPDGRRIGVPLTTIEDARP